MTEPTSVPVAATTDPITAILLAVTRIERDLAGALEQLKRHDAELVELRQAKDDHANRLTALEIRGQTDDQHHDRVISSRAAFWTAAGALVMFAALLVTLWVQHR